MDGVEPARLRKRRIEVNTKSVSDKKSPARSSVVVVAFSDPPATEALGTVRVLQATRHGSELVVQHWGAVASGSHGEGQATAVVKALTEAGIKERRVTVCLPSRSVATKRLQLPPCEPQDLPQLVAFEAQRYLSLPLDQIAAGYHIFPGPPSDGRPGGSNQDVLIAVTRKAELSTLERAMTAAGLTVEGYGVDSLAVTDAYLPASEAGLNGAARLVLAPDGAGIHAQVIAGERLLFNRFLPSNGGGWAADLRRSLAVYSVEHADAPIQDAVLVGEGDETALSGAIGLAVRRATVQPAQMGGLSVPPEYGALVGLARQWLGLGQYPLRLPPQGWEGAGKTQSQSRMLLGGALAATLAAGLVMWQVDQRRVRAEEIAKAGRISKQAERDRKQLARLARERDRLRLQVAAMGGAADASGAGAAPLELLSQVSARAPADVWLTQVNYQAGRPLQLLGTARNAVHVTDYVRSLETLKGFHRVALGFLRSASVENVPVTHFRIECALAGAEPPTAGASPAVSSAPRPAVREGEP